MRNNKEENKWKNGEVGGDAFLTDICKRVFAVVEHLRQHKHSGQLAKTANEKSKSLSVSFHTTFLI